MSHPFDIARLGQVFTPPAVVDAMLALRRNSGRVLEPSAGDGAFSGRLPGCVAIEADPRHAPPGAMVADFFAYPESERFQTIVGNPPYVRCQDIRPDTAILLRSDLFDGRSNLYLFFIEKAVRHLEPGGELIFITPRDFLKATSAVKLNAWLFEQGTITDAIELGDARIFDGAVPNCLIWRFERGNFSRRTRYAELGTASDLKSVLAAPPWEERHFMEVGGHLLFTRATYPLRVRDLFSVKVGAVSGADDLYGATGQTNRDFVCSETARTGLPRSMLWQAPGSAEPHPALLPHKERLISRRIRRFDESNWWQWGRACPETDAPRLYVNTKTRRSEPFFRHDCPYFDGAILGLFPLVPDVDLDALCAAMNAVDWAELGFVCDGRFIFSQRSLQNAPLPESFRVFSPLAV
ncbi:MAG: N6-adenine-specific methyltransferase, class [Rhodocyclaceae bacterium]|nr:N6-adenine-specific methyltransferase, class [Rhodocyclaceae bacterium]